MIKGEPRTSIEIERKREIINMTRAYTLFANKQPLGSISNGEKKTFAIPKGKLELYAKVDWCFSNVLSFTVEGDERRSFRVASSRKLVHTLWVAFAVILFDFILDTYFGIKFVVVLFFFPLGYMLYLLTFGRRKYLKLVEVK